MRATIVVAFFLREPEILLARLGETAPRRGFLTGIKDDILVAPPIIPAGFRQGIGNPASE